MQLNRKDWTKVWQKTVKSDNDHAKFNTRESLMMGFNFLGTKHMFGLPERSDHFLLKTTQDMDPYRLFTVDVFPHEEFNQ